MNITPNANDLWLGIGGHFNSISQVLCEFIDNSISNFRANRIDNNTILISINEIDENLINIKIEDNGTGFKNLEAAFTIGNKELKETELNEHGFGFKHALATADPQNKYWKVYTRTIDEFSQGTYKMLSAPYRYDLEEDNIAVADTPWKGQYNGTGTLIDFNISKTLFYTIRKGISSNAGFIRCLDYLKEELGYIYSGVIKDGIVGIKIISSAISNGSPYNERVNVVEPNIIGYYRPKTGNTTLDLGNGTVKIEYSFSDIADNTNLLKYYKKNMSTSGLEIRINGRLLMSNIFKEVWNLENHPSYNHILVIINLVSDNTDALPKTKTSKNGIRVGDEKLEKLYSWVSNIFKPSKKSSNIVLEADLVQQLYDLKETQLEEPKSVVQQYEAFITTDSPVKLDLYVFNNNKTILYECKKDQSTIQNLYQLMMYWDGIIEDGGNPDVGRLIASNHPTAVKNLVDRINSMKDQNDNKYYFELKTWKSEGINYPNED